MTTRDWHRLTARTVLIAFTAATLGCGNGGSSSQAPAPTTNTANAQTPPPAAEPPPPPAPPPPPPQAQAQPQAQPPPPPEPLPPSPTLPQNPPDQLSKEELRELVAPIALYPDVVLGSLLPATTFPEQVHDAALYAGDAVQVEKIPEDRGWDGSVLGLLQFPDVLRWLDENPAWTDEMGQAVTYQQGDVLQAIQDYRRQVSNAGNLKSNQYQKVRSVREDILIEPAQPDVVYVPSYDPVAAVQPQPVVTSPGYVAQPGINPWIAFGGGAVVGALGAWALYSIFDDDDHDHYYGGGGGYGWRGIRRYDNYYYNRGRRPRPYEWAPRARPYRSRPANWNRPRRLEYRQARRDAMVHQAPLRAPMTKPVRAEAVRRDMRQEQKLQQQQNRQQRQEMQRQQRQEQQQRQQERRQQQQQQRQDRRQQQQEQKQQNQQRNQEQKQQNQQRKQDQRQQRQQQQQQRQQGQREQRQQQQQQRQQQQMQRQERHQENRQQQQQQRQERREQNPNQNQNKNKKKKQNQNQG